jgi:hypothetical protein
MSAFALIANHGADVAGGPKGAITGSRDRQKKCHEQPYAPRQPNEPDPGARFPQASVVAWRLAYRT